MNEAQLEEYFRKRVRLMGGYTIKLAPTERGVPDRLVMMPGGFMYLVELKADGGKVSPIQAAWHRRLLENYQTTVHVLTGAAAVRLWIARIVNDRTPPRKAGRPRKTPEAV